MTESTVRAERFEPQSSTPLCYTWAVPQMPVSVRIPFALIDRLDQEVVACFRSVHARGSEIGGLLLGYVQPGDPAAVSLQDYELIECDYSRGPLYRLSDGDIARFERAIEQRRAAPSGPGGLVAAGFFRSHTRKGLALDADDLALFQARFPDPRNIALLIRPFATKASTAGIFIWEDGAVHGDGSHLEFPFRSSELAASKPLEQAAPPVREEAPPAPPAAPAPKPPARAQIVPIAPRRESALPPPSFAEMPAPETAPEKDPEPVSAAPATAPAPAQAPAAAPASAAAPATAPENKAWNPLPSAPIWDAAAPAATEYDPTLSPPVTRRAIKVTRMSVAAAAGFVAITLLFVYPGFLRHSSQSQISTPQDSSQLALRVEHSGGELMLTWNRESNAIKHATRAVLSISDGTQHENVDMDLAQLRNGSIVYSPSSSDIVFRMEVTGSDQAKTTSESVRVLRTRPSPMPEPGQPAQSGGAAPPQVPADSASAPGNVGAPDSAPQEPAAQAESRPTPTPLKQFNADSLSQRLRPARPTDMPEAPEVGRGGEALSAAVPVGVSAMPAPALTSAPQAPAAVPQSAPAQTANTARKAANGGQVQQAEVIFRKDPDYPPIARQSGAQGQVVLTALIGADGKVKDVKVMQGHPLLRNAAVAAVKQWVYKPTLLNGVAVEAETRITLNFVPRK